MRYIFLCFFALSLALLPSTSDAVIKVACVGDSITEGNGSTDMYSKSYPGVLRTLLGAGYEVGNFGRGGATLLPYSGTYCYTNTEKFLPSVSYAGDILLIMLGTNDGATEGGCQYHLDEFTNSYDQLIAHYTAGRNPVPRVIVATPAWVCLPNGPWSQDTIHNKISPIVRSYAATRGYTLVDINLVTWGHTNDPTWYSDSVHLTDAGYQNVAQAFYAAVTNGTVSSTPFATIRCNGNAINDGSSTPASGNGTDFGTTPAITGSTQHVFRIQNDGSADLQLTGSPAVTLSGTHASDFTVTSQPGSTTIGVAAYTEFTVRFIPSAGGLRTATVSVQNNDAARSPYDFAISGTGMVPAPTTFTAYNDLGTGLGQPTDKITTRLMDGSTGTLVDYVSGLPLDVQVTLTGGTLWPGTGAGYAPAGTPAATVFPSNIIDCAVHSYFTSGTAIFSGLVPTNKYTFVFYANRDGGYTDRYTTVTISGADAFENNSTAGAANQSATSATIMSGVSHGNVFRFDQVNPGTDGTVSFTAGGVSPCLNAFMVQTPSTSSVTPPTGSTVLLPETATWKYLDNNSDLGTTWRGAFSDGTWLSGPAPLGYPAGASITTLTGYGADGGNKYVTTYFRTTFNVTNLASVTGVLFNAKVDDGCVIYLNGKYVGHTNMNWGVSNIAYNTYASGLGPDARPWLAFPISKSNLVQGANIVAVEVHQISAGSSDIHWQMKADLVDYVTANPTTPEVTNSVPVTNVVSTGWAAYNDFNLQAGELNSRITSYWTSNGTNGGGTLIEYATGLPLAARVDMSLSDPALAAVSQWGLQQQTDGGTDAANIFTNKVSPEGYMNWANQIPLTITLSQLNAAKKYKVALYGNRVSYDGRVMLTTISSVDAFVNQSSAGSTIDTVSMVNDQTIIPSTNQAGRVALYTDIQPGADGTITFTVQAGGLYSGILNAMRVEELPDAGGTDGDTDGMADDWEQQHFGGTGSTNGGNLEDYDQDGSCNYDEYRAGTDPTSAGSKLEFTQSQMPTNLVGQMVLTWPGVAGKSYSLLSATNPAAAWTTLRSGIAGVSPTTVATANVSTVRTFWRIKVE